VYAKALKELSWGPLVVAIAMSITAGFVWDNLGFYYVTGKFLIIALSMLTFSFLVFAKELNFAWPSSRTIQISLVAVGIFTFISAILTHIGERVTGVNLVLAWLLIMLAISAIVQKKGSEDFVKKFLLYQMPFIAFSFVYFLVSEFVFKEQAKPFFGNPNIASNYIAIAVVQILFFYRTAENKAAKIGGLIFAALGLFLLFWFQARGAMLGLGLGATYFFISSAQKKKSSSYKKAIMVAALLIAAGIGFTQFQKGSNTIKYRYSFWINTLCMIKDFPMGVGPGSFEYVFQHYNGRCVPTEEIGEQILIRNPHNSFIEFFSEIGIGGGIAFLILLFVVFAELKRRSEKRSPLGCSWVFSNSLVFLAIAMFEFPQDTPFTYFYLAIVAGVAWATLPGGPARLRSRSLTHLRMLHLSLSALSMLVFVLKIYSAYLSANPGKTREQRFTSFNAACAIDNENWRACTFVGLDYIEVKDFEKADKVIDRLSHKFEGHHSLMHLRGTYGVAKGDKGLACEQFRLYHALFGYHSSKKKYLEENCLN
jgi:O-antigen ligase